MTNADTLASPDNQATSPEVHADAVDKRADRIKAMFAGVAPRYDLLNHVLSLNIDRVWRAFTLRKVRAQGSAPILDVCTGTGDLALGYKRQVGSQAQVTGIDFCGPMLERARQKASKQKLEVTFLEGDALQLPVNDDTYQIVSVAFGLRNVADVNKGLAELVRAAQPGGRVAILEFSRPRVPVLRWAYLAYFRHLLPRIGQSISKNKHDAYHYLPASVLAFPDGQDMLDLMAEHGLAELKQYPLTFGIATLYVGTKTTGEDIAQNG